MTFMLKRANQADKVQANFKLLHFNFFFLSFSVSKQVVISSSLLFGSCVCLYVSMWREQNVQLI